jgi:hypothetical protein
MMGKALLSIVLVLCFCGQVRVQPVEPPYGKEAMGLKCAVLSLVPDVQPGFFVLTGRILNVKEGAPAVRGLEKVSLGHYDSNGKLTATVDHFVSPSLDFVLQRIDRFDFRMECSIPQLTKKVELELGTSGARSLTTQVPPRMKD